MHAVLGRVEVITPGLPQDVRDFAHFGVLGAEHERKLLVQH
jgi:hypothetical protein